MTDQNLIIFNAIIKFLAHYITASRFINRTSVTWNKWMGIARQHESVLPRNHSALFLLAINHISLRK